MSTDELINRLEQLDERELLEEVNVRYFLSLPPELADAAFRGAILRWLNSEVLQAVLGVGAVSGVDGLVPERQISPKELYDQLRKLRFAEEYPARGHSFHDLTRELVLGYLWKKEPDFYRQVSDRAAEHFKN